MSIRMIPIRMTMISSSAEFGNEADTAAAVAVCHDWPEETRLDSARLELDPEADVRRARLHPRPWKVIEAARDERACRSQLSGGHRRNTARRD